MQLTEKTTMSMKARLSRAAAGAAVMSVILILAAAFHLTPGMAASNRTDDHAAQSQTETAPAPPAAVKPKSSAPAVASPEGHTTERLPDLTTEERDAIHGQVDQARQGARLEDWFNSPESQREMDEAMRQAVAGKELFESDQLQRQMQEVERQGARLEDWFNSPEFKKQMEDVQEQALPASAMVNSPEFRRQMEDIKGHAEEMAKRFNSDNCKRQMDESQGKMDEMMKDCFPEEVPPTKNP